MKLSLAWIFEHLDGGRLCDVDVPALVAKFNTHTAEIGNFTQLAVDPELYELVRCQPQAFGYDFVLPDQKKVSLPQRSDLFAGCYYLIKRPNDKNGNDYGWANYEDFFYPSNDGNKSLLPLVLVSENEFLTKAWKQFLPQNDVILEVDNTSLTNRPDMWGHRGFAREIALLLNLRLKGMPAAQLTCHKEPLAGFTSAAFASQNLALEACTAFSLTKFNGGQNQATHPKLLLRLLAIGQKSINAFVDLTNYVMFDLGHPLHAFAADKLSNAPITVRFARENEQLTLLDNTTINLESRDLIVAQDDAALALAGIKGGLSTAITIDTTDILLEVANFRPDVIRKTSVRKRIRTDASARFEKNLDAQQIPSVVARFVSLASECQINIGTATPTYFATKGYEPRKIEVTHQFLTTFTGLALTPQMVVQTLTKLDFAVQIKQMSANLAKSLPHDEIIYDVIVPSFRATKNIMRTQDLVEEVARTIGFENIAAQVPYLARAPYDLDKTLALRFIKRYLAYGANMVEQANYPFFDEDFLQQISYDPGETAALANPVSEKQCRLVTTLIAGLLKNVYHNKSLLQDIAFFEIAKIWPWNKKSFCEKKVVAGVWIAKHGEKDFYAYKQYIEQLFHMRGKLCHWVKDGVAHKWEHSAQTAALHLDDRVIGRACMLDMATLLALGFEPFAKGFAFEVEVEPLLDNNFKNSCFKPISKFPASYFDVSMFVPISLTLQKVGEVLTNLHPLVSEARLLDIFEKKTESQKSLTFRVLLQSYERSIEKVDVNLVSSMATTALQQLGAIVRI